jgi:hypothetical protein
MMGRCNCGVSESFSYGGRLVDGISVGPTYIHCEKVELSIQVSDINLVAVDQSPWTHEAKKGHPIVKCRSDGSDANLQGPTDIDRSFDWRALASRIPHVFPERVRACGQGGAAELTVKCRGGTQAGGQNRARHRGRLVADLDGLSEQRRPALATES